MPTSHELSHAVRTRRQDIGLSLERLAALTGMSAEQIASVESGAIDDLGFNQAVVLLEALGLGLVVSPAHPRPRKQMPGESPLVLAARTASTSYVGLIPPESVADALLTGRVPSDYWAHMHALLDEAPIALLARAVEQVHVDSNLAREELWANMRKMARLLKSRRAIWSEDC